MQLKISLQWVGLALAALLTFGAFCVPSGVYILVLYLLHLISLHVGFTYFTLTIGALVLAVCQLIWLVGICEFWDEQPEAAILPLTNFLKSYMLLLFGLWLVGLLCFVWLAWP